MEIMNEFFPFCFTLISGRKDRKKRHFLFFQHLTCINTNRSDAFALPADRHMLFVLVLQVFAL